LLYLSKAFCQMHAEKTIQVGAMLLGACVVFAIALIYKFRNSSRAAEEGRRHALQKRRAMIHELAREDAERIAKSAFAQKASK